MNPGAGGGRRAGGAGLELPPGVETRSPARPHSFVRRVASSYDRVLVYGGDGTVSAVARGLVEGGSPSILGVIPGGTGNDFAAALQIPDDPDEAVRLALTGRPRTIDLGAVNGRPFVNAVTMGPAAELSQNTGKRVKAVLGRYAYLFEALRHPGSLRSFDAALDVDGEHVEGAFLFVGVANGRRVGGGTQVAPGSILTDGLLDLVLLPDAPLTRLAGALRALRNGSDHPLLIRHRARDIEVLTRSADLCVSLDGEKIRGRRLRFSVLRRALRVVVPRRSPAVPPLDPSGRPRRV